MTNPNIFSTMYTARVRANDIAQSSISNYSSIHVHTHIYYEENSRTSKTIYIHCLFQRHSAIVH